MKGLKATHTFVTLELSQKAYDEIAAKLRAAGYDHAFHPSGAIDMHGIGVTRSEQPAPRNGHLEGSHGHA